MMPIRKVVDDVLVIPLILGSKKICKKEKVLSGFEPELQGSFAQIKTLGDNQLHYRTNFLIEKLPAFSCR